MRDMFSKDLEKLLSVGYTSEIAICSSYKNGNSRIFRLMMVSDKPFHWMSFSIFRFSKNSSMKYYTPQEEEDAIRETVTVYSEPKNLINAIRSFIEKERMEENYSSMQILIDREQVNLIM